MNQASLKLLGYDEILDKLKNCALTDKAKDKILKMQPVLSENKLRKYLRETSQAKQMIELSGTPPLPGMEHIEVYVDKAVRGELILPEQLEELELFLNALRRLKTYLIRGTEQGIGIAYYNDNLVFPEELEREIERCIRGGKVDDYASPVLKNLKRQIQLLEEKLSEKAERALNVYKSCLSDAFVVSRNGRLCIPVKKACRSMVPGNVVDKSSTGVTLFIEPETTAKVREELEIYRIEADEEERRILYALMELVADCEDRLRENIRVIESLDFMFAKAKLSLEMDAAEPEINLDNHIRLVEAKHPMLSKADCVPLNFEIGNGIKGVIITGPNTGGKTVAIKTVALMSAMACSGLHVPCRHADISMQNQILCDIGDGQNISDNLSTFSSHIKNVLDILKSADKDSLVIMDELGSGTAPAEGMGIAVAILEELKKSGALFLVTTHYPEVKEYADRYEDIVNARMEFDRESLRPMYQLKVGEAGESCALYIAKHLGFPDNMLVVAAKEAYGEKYEEVLSTLNTGTSLAAIEKRRTPKIERTERQTSDITTIRQFAIGDSVEVMPEKHIGIVVKPADRKGNVLVQVKREKVLVNHKRLKLKVSASELYPEDYDFSIIFDTVENRKARHQMDKHHQDSLIIQTDGENQI